MIAVMTTPTSINLENIALAALARREHSRLELTTKLEKAGGEPLAIQALLDDLQSRGWQSDARFSELVCHVRAPRFGLQRIGQELRQKGVDDALIQESMLELKASEFARARAVWEKKFGQPAQDAKQKAKQMRFLQSRGFSFEVIFKILDGKSDAA